MAWVEFFLNFADQNFVVCFLVIKSQGNSKIVYLSSLIFMYFFEIYFMERTSTFNMSIEFGLKIKEAHCG